MTCKQTIIGFSLALVATGVSGCGGKPVFKLPPTAPFSGTVKLDDKPLVGAMVTFVPTGKQEVMAGCKTDANGKYDLMTVGDKPVKGAVPGDYKVRISLTTTPDGKPVEIGKKGAIPGRESLKPEYSDTAKTKLKATVSEKGGTQDFELKSK